MLCILLLIQMTTGPVTDLPSDDLVKFEVLDYAVTPALFREMCDLLELKEDERAAAEEAYSAYWPKALALDQMAKRTRRDAGEEEWHLAAAEARNKTYFSDPPVNDEEADRLWKRVGELVYQVKLARVQPSLKCDRLTGEFFDTLATSLERPRESLAPAERSFAAKCS